MVNRVLQQKTLKQRRKGKHKVHSLKTVNTGSAKQQARPTYDGRDLGADVYLQRYLQALSISISIPHATVLKTQRLHRLLFRDLYTKSFYFVEINFTELIICRSFNYGTREVALTDSETSSIRWKPPVSIVEEDSD